MGTIEAIDQSKIEDAGWGAIFALGDERADAIKEALSPLLAHRKKQAQTIDERRYKEYTGVAAYRPSKENKTAFLARHGAAPGPANPNKVPYYLLIVGDPKSIPYTFQYQVDVQYAVGRIWFETIDEYANYAQSVVDAETKKLALPRRGAFWGVSIKGDAATELSSQRLVTPLHEWASEEQPAWLFDSYIGPAKATKKQLTSLLGGSQTPAFLFAASHGVLFPRDDPLQLPHQGALLCQEWRGLGHDFKRDFYFSGEDLDSSTNLLGLIALLWATFSAGTPQYDEFYKIANKNRSEVAPYPFVANLPRQMLNRPKGGALAVIGYTERVWEYSFMEEREGRVLESFQNTLKRLLEGHPIGSAVESFNERYAEMASDLSMELEDVDAGAVPNARRLAQRWVGSDNSRGLSLVGDPAVRLMVAEEGATAISERPSITINSFVKEPQVDLIFEIQQLYLNIEANIPQNLVIGDSLTFSFSLSPYPNSKTLHIPINVPLTTLEVTLYFEVERFQLTGEHTRSLIFVPSGSLGSNKQTVEVTALRSGNGRISLKAYSDSRLKPVEYTFPFFPIAKPEHLPAIPELIDRRNIPEPQPDVVLYVSLEEGKHEEEVWLYLTCPALGMDREKLEQPLTLTASDLRALRQTAAQLAIGTTNVSPTDTQATLQAFGGALYDQLMPYGHPLRHVYRRIIDAEKKTNYSWTWLVVADDRAVLPWEMVCPYGYTSNGELWYDRFLGDRFLTSHWIGRAGFRLASEVPLLLVDMVHYNQHPNEIKWWYRALGGKDSVQVETEPGKLALMQRGSLCYGLHLLNYTDGKKLGQITAIAKTTEPTGEQEITQSMIEDTRLDLTLHHPLVGISFIGGGTNGGGVSLGKADTQLVEGWVLPFLRAGATALVAPRWPVLPDSDLIFVENFYNALRSGATVGWAVWNARKAVHETFPARSDWLSYTYFGHPLSQPYLIHQAEGFVLFEAVDHSNDQPFIAGKTYYFRASYRTEAPAWYQGRLKVAQLESLNGDVIVRVKPWSESTAKSYELQQFATGQDYQTIVPITMPDEVMLLPITIRFIKNGRNLHTINMELNIVEKLL